MISNHIARKVGEIVQKRIDHLGIGQKMQDLPEELWHESFRFYVKEDPTRRGGPNMRMIRLDPKKPSLFTLMKIDLLLFEKQHAFKGSLMISHFGVL